MGQGRRVVQEREDESGQEGSTGEGGRVRAGG